MLEKYTFCKSRRCLAPASPAVIRSSVSKLFDIETGTSILIRRVGLLIILLMMTMLSMTPVWGQNSSSVSKNSAVSETGKNSSGSQTFRFRSSYGNSALGAAGSKNSSDSYSNNNSKKQLNTILNAEQDNSSSPLLNNTSNTKSNNGPGFAGQNGVTTGSSVPYYPMRNQDRSVSNPIPAPAPEPSGQVIAVPAADPAPHRPIQYVLTRQGIIREGVVFDRDNSVYVQLINQKGGFTISKLDILHIASAREDLFVCRLAQIPPSDIGEQLKLADWAVRNQLIPSAVKMLNELLPTVNGAMKSIVEKKIQELETIEKIRLRALKARTIQVSKLKKNNPQEIEKQEWENWSKTFPVSVHDQYIKSVQPVLVKRCGTDGCHGNEDSQKFILHHKRNELPTRVSNLKNLAAVLHRVNFLEPSKSAILEHPGVQNEKGERVYPFGNDNGSLRDYKIFLKWIESTSGKMQSVTPSPDDRTVSQNSKSPVLPDGAVPESSNVQNGEDLPRRFSVLSGKKENGSSVTPENSKSVQIAVNKTELDKTSFPNSDRKDDTQNNNSLNSKEHGSEINGQQTASDMFVFQKVDKNKKIVEIGSGKKTSGNRIRKIENSIVIPKDIYDPVQFNSRYHPSQK